MSVGELSVISKLPATVFTNAQTINTAAMFFAGVTLVSPKVYRQKYIIIGLKHALFSAMA